MDQRLRWVISVDEQTQARRERLQKQFAPLVGDNLSRLVRLVFEAAEFLGFTPETVVAMMMQPQGLTEATAEQPVAQCHNSSQVFPNAKKPPMRITASEGSGARRREVRNISRRSCLMSAASVRVVEASVFSFPLNSTRFSGVAA